MNDREWNPSIWWFRWLVLWRDIAHANVPRAGGTCAHRRCIERQHRLGCRAFALTSEQTREYKKLKNSHMPIAIAP